MKDTELTMREILTGHVHTRERGTNMESTPDFPHLKFDDIEDYKKALAFAEKLGGEALASFKSSFQVVENISARAEGTGEVHMDALRHSFYFRIYRKDNSLDIDGGIILHGMGNSFSVELCPKTGIYWSVHT